MMAIFNYSDMTNEDQTISSDETSRCQNNLFPIETSRIFGGNSLSRDHEFFLALETKVNARTVSARARESCRTRPPPIIRSYVF